MGIDLSLTSTGIAEFASTDPWGDVDLYVDRIRTSGKKDDNLVMRRARLNTILVDIAGRVNESCDDLDLVVLEAPSFASQHGSAHDRSGLWWLVVDMLCEYQLPVATVSPQGRAKYATGKGNADKQAVFGAVCNTYREFDAIREVNDLGWRQGNDMADAVALAAMGRRHLGKPVERVSEAQYQAYLAADWPEELAA
jgi:crossover junction endodeoxyribonuclease RuvC